MSRRFVDAAYPVAGTSNVLQLLLLLEERQYLSLTDVSSELGIGTSTAHRLLAMLRQFGFVDQDERSHIYRVGPDLLTMSRKLSARHAMLMRIRPVVNTLVEDINETVHVAVLNGPMVSYIDCVESRKSERATSRTGRVMPAYATASGKALLAGLPRERIEALFSELLTPLTSRTLTTRERLLQDISITARRGFATNENESQLGFFSYSSLVKTPADVQPIAIVIAGPSRRFRKNSARFADCVCRAAEKAAS